MKRDFLKGFGLEETEVNRIMAENGKDIERLKAENEAQRSRILELEQLIEEANAKMEGIGGANLQEMQQQTEQYKLQMEQMQFDYALEKALKETGAKNMKAMKALIDPETLVFGEDGVIEGLDEQLEQIKTECPYLFESGRKMPEIVMPSAGNGQSGVDTVRAAMGLK